jgi:hypothetical protein
MLQYGSVTGKVLASWVSQYRKIPEEHQRMLGGFKKGWAECGAATQQNAAVLRAIVMHAEAEGSIGPALTAAGRHSSTAGTAVSPLDASKVLSVFGSCRQKAEF